MKSIFPRYRVMFFFLLYGRRVQSKPLAESMNTIREWRIFGVNDIDFTVVLDPSKTLAWTICTWISLGLTKSQIRTLGHFKMDVYTKDGLKHFIETKPFYLQDFLELRDLS